MKVLLVVLLLAVSATAQSSNIHVAAEVGGASSLGFSGCLCGGAIGGDIRKSRFDFSAEFEALRARKETGGSGYEVRGHEAGRFYFGKAFVEGDFEQTHYSVTQFSKTHIFAGGGVGVMVNEHVLLRGAFLTHVSESAQPKGIPTNQNFGEGQVQFFGKHHVYFSPRVVVSRFTSGGQRSTGAVFSIQIGLWR